MLPTGKKNLKTHKTRAMLPTNKYPQFISQHKEQEN